MFAKSDKDDFAENFEQGKCYPGLHLHGKDGKEIHVLFAATPKASMTSVILMETFKRMDKLGIPECGVDENGKKFWPLFLIDGPTSRMDDEFLIYVNKESTRWESQLSASYGISKWQYHDDTQMNRSFKMQLADESAGSF